MTREITITAILIVAVVIGIERTSNSKQETTVNRNTHGLVIVVRRVMAQLWHQDVSHRYGHKHSQSHSLRVTVLVVVTVIVIVIVRATVRARVTAVIIMETI